MLKISDSANLPSNSLRVMGLLLSWGILAACSRQYAVTINEQTLYDPRGQVASTRFADPGLQACISFSMQQQSLEKAEDITVLTCAGLEIRSLNGLEALRDLQFIDVTENRLIHLDALRGMNRLRSVNAASNPLTDISALFTLTTLSSAIFAGSDNIPCSQLDRLADQIGANLTRPVNCAN